MAKILVVDDLASIRTALMNIVRDCGHEALEAESAEVALRLTCMHDFGLVITDLTMDGMSGIELLQTLRERGVGTPVILISALDDHYAKLLAKFDFARILQKPADTDAITSALMEALDRRAS